MADTAGGLGFRSWKCTVDRKIVMTGAETESREGSGANYVQLSPKLLILMPNFDWQRNLTWPKGLYILKHIYVCFEMLVPELLKFTRMFLVLTLGLWILLWIFKKGNYNAVKLCRKTLTSRKSRPLGNMWPSNKPMFKHRAKVVSELFTENDVSFWVGGTRGMVRKVHPQRHRDGRREGVRHWLLGINNLGYVNFHKVWKRVHC